MAASFSQTAPVLVWSAAGLCLFLMLFNRYLILMPDSRWKTAAVVFAFALITGGAAVLGWVLPQVPWITAPACVIGLILIGFRAYRYEGSRLITGASHSGTS